MSTLTSSSNHSHYNTATVSGLSSSLTAFWDSLSPGWQFFWLTMSVFFFFGSHNLLQEALMQILEHQHGVMLGYLEVLGVTLCTALEAFAVSDYRRQAPLSAYPQLTLCLLSSSALSNWSLNYINFPTKVVFRSSKLIPTMILASILHKQIFSLTEYGCASAICAGLILFAAADWRTTPSFHPIGLLLVILSVVADAILPNAQQAVFSRYQSSRLEVTLYTNVLTLAAYTVTTAVTGEIKALSDLVMDPPEDQSGLLPYYIVLYTIVSYLAITAHMTVVRTYGGVAAIVVATARKGLTLILSFILFPKVFSWYYPAGACLVLGGLGVASWYRQKLKEQQQQQYAVAHDTDHKMHAKTSDIELQHNHQQQQQQHQQQRPLLQDLSSSSRHEHAADKMQMKNSNHGLPSRT